MELQKFYIDSIVSAQFTVNGKEYDSAIWEQAGKHYVTTGSRVTKDFTRYDFTEDQEQQYYKFLEHMRLEKYVSVIVRKSGGYREKAIYNNPHFLEITEEWNDFHKVVEIKESSADSDGHRNSFLVDIVTKTICG